ncbi:MAG TPA: selenocysteine-specific translation elongation factor, partial [Chthoniobacterales bacterium]|nr:selenocysteine-specific translation elongation factor [Chthoniobacterales bacterium]
MKHCILATAGHVDHGKTTLIKALTGTDTDRLPEEKARGITIDLGFAHLSLPGLSIGVIDVPGHEDFVRNMIAGIGSIDLALLVVAADDGWMPQTEEHLQLLHYVGVQQAVVAVTKSDVGDAARVRSEVHARLAGTAFAAAPIIITAARTGGGIEELKTALAQQLAELTCSSDIGKPRLFVDRVFTARGSGTVVTGTLLGGRFTRGQAVSVEPHGLTSRLRGLQSHNQAVEFAVPGMRTALNLADVTTEQLERGAIITAPASGDAAMTIDAQITRSSRLPPTARALRNDTTVHVHYGSARAVAHITLLDCDELLPGKGGIARLRFASRIFVFAGDRFIMRDSSEQQTLGGGIVLDPEADGVRFRSRAQRAFLSARAEAPNDCAVLLRPLLEREHFQRRFGLLQKSRCSAEEVDEAVRTLCAAGQLWANAHIVADAGWWRDLRKRAAGIIDEEHRAHPDRAGLDVAQLRSVLRNPPSVFDSLVTELCRDGFAQVRNAIKRAAHRPSLPPHLQSAGERIRTLLAQHRLEPPSRAELASNVAEQQALRFLCESGEVVAVNEDVLLAATAFAQAKNAIAEHLRRNPAGATLSELRQALGSTRRVMVPLLERLDRDGLTIRNGDRRRL